MAYRVSFARRAVRDFDRLYASINAAKSDAALSWFLKLQETIGLLAATPHMGTVTHENASRRQLVYGNKPHFYRVIYTVDEDVRLVTILQVRHGKKGQADSMKPKFIPLEASFTEWKKDPKNTAAYNSLDEEFALASSLIKARSEADIVHGQATRSLPPRR